jgi:hypothetical protein
MNEMEQQPTTETSEANLYVSEESETPAPQGSPQGVSWTASEYLHHQKSANWFIVFVGALVITSLLIYILMDDWIAPASVAILGGLLGVAAVRKPRTLQYVVDEHGIVVGRKEYGYDDFLSFSVMQEGPIESIVLIPQKRWAPAINLYFAPDDGQRIFEVLSTFLPFEEREKDTIDKFLHKIRF